MTRWHHHGLSMRGYPGEMPRLAWLGITGSGDQLTEAEPPDAGMAVRGHAECELAPDSGAVVQWVNHAKLGGQSRGAYLVHPPYRGGVGYTFWQRDTDVPPAAELTFFTGMGPRSPEPIWLSAVGVHPAPDAIYREFEHGLVLGNPAPHGYCFDLARLLPGRKFRRLRGSAEQDPTTNNGSAVDGPVTPGPKDGLFLIRQ